jgi:hypothetical protein
MRVRQLNSPTFVAAPKILHSVGAIYARFDVFVKLAGLECLSWNYLSCTSMEGDLKILVRLPNSDQVFTRLV